MRAYRFALDPSAAQARDLERHAGAARFAFNWALAQVKANIGQRTAERSYGVDGEDLTASLGWNLPALRRAWNAAKSEIAPWWSECSKEAFNTGLDGVARSPEELGGLQVRQACRPHGWVPALQGPPSHHTQRAVHHRGDPRLRPTVSM